MVFFQNNIVFDKDIAVLSPDVSGDSNNSIILASVPLELGSNSSNSSNSASTSSGSHLNVDVGVLLI